MMIGNYLTDGKSSLTAFKDYWALLHFGSINFCDFPSSSGHSKFVQPSLNIQGLENFGFFKIQNWRLVACYFKPLLFQIRIFCEATLNAVKPCALSFPPGCDEHSSPCSPGRLTFSYHRCSSLSLSPVATNCHIINRRLGGKKPNLKT